MSELVGAVVRRAARRWPADMRDEMATEWLAELAAMGRERVPGWRRIAYAMSLLMSAPVEEPGRPPRLWREEFPSLGRAASHLLTLVVVAWTAAFAASQLPTFANFLLSEARGDYPGTYYIGQATTVQWAANAVAVASLALACAGFGWLGTRLGRVMPLRWARHIGLGAAGPGVVASVVIGATLAGTFALDVVGGTPGATMSAGGVGTVALWTVLAMLVTWSAVRLARRRWLAVLVGVVGYLVTLEIVGILVSSSGPGKALWFPLSLFDLEHSGISYGDAITYHVNVNTVGAMVRPMLVCAAFLLRYAFRAGRANPIAATLRTVAAAPRRASVDPIRYAFAGTLMAAGLALWAYTGAWLTPATEAIVNGPDELPIWLQEQRELAIWLVVVALVLAIIRRGPVALPAFLTYVLLFTADCIVDAHGLSGPRTGMAMVLVGVIVLAGAWWLSGRISLRPADPVETRRVAAAVAIAAALPAPVLATNFQDIQDFQWLPAGLVPAALAVMALVWCAAVAVACTARETAPSKRVVAAYVVVPLIVLSGIGAYGGLDQTVMYGAGPALGLVVMSVVLGRGTVRPLRWLLLGLAGVVAGIPYIVGSVLIGMTVGGALMAAAGFEYPSDGAPFMPGALPLAVGAGLSFAQLVVRSAPAVPQPDPAAADGEPVGLLPG